MFRESKVRRTQPRKLLFLLAALALFLASCATGGDDDASESSDAGDSSSATFAGASATTQAESEDFEFDSPAEEAMEDQAFDGDDSGDSDRGSVQLRTTGADQAFAPGANTTVPSAAPDSGGDPAAAPDPEASVPQIATQAEDFGRDIIRTATVTAEVDNVIDAGAAATRAVRAVGGYVAGQNTVTTGNQDRATLTFKVPPRDFDETLANVGGVGKVLEQTISASDVTERIVNLQSQITTSEASVERLRSFLANASDLTEVARFEAQLLERETQLELLRGQVRTLQNQVGLSTITLTLLEKVPPAPVVEMELVVTAYGTHDGGATCPGTDSPELTVGDPVTLCYELTNAGDTALTEFAFRDEALDLQLRDLTVLSGSTEVPLEPGDSIVWAYEAEAEGFNLVSQAQVNAEAVLADDGDDPISVAAIGRLDTRLTQIVEQTGFTDGLSTGWDALTGIVRVMLVVLGFALPFIWVVPLLWIGVREWRKRRDIKEEAAREARAAVLARNTPPPPANPEPVAAGVGANDPSD